MKQNPANVDNASVRAFGYEWSRFDHSLGHQAELAQLFERYFEIFPWSQLPADPIGFDFGCGSGRWARMVAPRAAVLHCLDASQDALEVAQRNLRDSTNCRFQHCVAETIPLADSSADFGFSLGVLHHIPDSQKALNACVRKLKPGAPFLLYVYYNLENRPAWFRNFWRASILPRILISRLPNILKVAVCDIIAAIVYLPLARLAKVFHAGDQPGRSFPLSQYRTSSFYTMRTDALDRFGTPLEHRFSRQQVERMMLAAGLTNIRFRETVPFWVAVGNAC
jgi:SAM-dependent methyltransferase